MALLQNWDGVIDKDRPEPLIFLAWLYEMRRSKDLWLAPSCLLSKIAIA